MILVCAATRTEARACAAARGIEVLRTGVGAAHAAAALALRLASGPRPSLVVSSGFAGALSGGLRLHACVTAGEVFRLEQGRAVALRFGRGQLRAAAGAQRCAVLSAGGVLRGDAPKVPSPAVVDMESAALAEVAGRAGVPFAVLRVLTDTPAAPFPGFVSELGAALAPGPRLARLRAAARVARDALRAPRTAAAFVRSSLVARSALAAAWRQGGAGLVAQGAARAAAAPGPGRRSAP